MSTSEFTFSRLQTLEIHFFSYQSAHMRRRKHLVVTWIFSFKCCLLSLGNLFCVFQTFLLPTASVILYSHQHMFSQHLRETLITNDTRQASRKHWRNDFLWFKSSYKQWKTIWWDCAIENLKLLIQIFKQVLFWSR